MYIDEIAAVLQRSSFTEDDMGKIEEFLEEANEAARGGETLVADSVYDRVVEILRTYKPDSPMLSEIWEKPDEDSSDSQYSSLLRKHPMMSILTVKKWDSPDISKFLNYFEDSACSFHLSYKIDGHGVRVAYQRGVLVSATSRARSSAGRNLTSQMRNIVPEYLPKLSEIPLCEIRGELCLREDKLEEARRFTPGLKSAFSAVSSLIKPSSSVEENKLLDFLAYAYYDEAEEVQFGFKSDEYEFLRKLGFQTPEYTVVEVTGYEDFLDNLQSSVVAFEEGYQDFGYFCDGVVLEVEDRTDFHDLGSEGSHNRGNLALKVNSWAQDLYSGIIDHIEWTPGKTKLTPVAVLEGDGVLTTKGSTVKNVPLYNPAVMYMLDAYSGEPLSFRFGGEAGVVPVYPDGSLITDRVIGSILDN